MTMNDSNITMIIAGFLIVVLLSNVGAWIVAIWHIKDLRRSVLYIAEIFFLISVVLLLAWGTRDTVLKVVDSFQRDKVVFSPNQNKAVLAAYDKLSGEMNRWLVMFVVLGSFFGLVLPIGAYLLQMKEIARKEDAVDAKLKEEHESRKEEIEKVMSEIGRAQDTARKTVDLMTQTKMQVTELQLRSEERVRNLWKSQVAMSIEGLAALIQDMGDCNWDLNKIHAREFGAALISFLMYLGNTETPAFISEQLSVLARLLGLIKSKGHVSDEKIEEWARKLAVRKEKPRIKLSSYVEGDDEKIAFEEVQSFAKKFGIDVL